MRKDFQLYSIKNFIPITSTSFSTYLVMSSYSDRLKVRLKVLFVEILSCKSSYEIIKVVFKVHRLELFTREEDMPNPNLSLGLDI